MTGTALVRVGSADVAPQQPASSPVLVAAIDSWATTLAEGGTRRTYTAAVKAMLASQGDITPAKLAIWRDELVRDGRARATVRLRLAAVRAFAAWAAAGGLVPIELVRQLATIQAPALEGQHTPLELRPPHVRLLDLAAGTAWPDDPLRTAHARAVVRLLAGCGLRVGELAEAKRSHMVPARPSAADRAELAGRGINGWALNVRGKGGKRRTVPVPATVRAAVLVLHRLLDERVDALVPALTAHRPARLAAPHHPTPTRTLQALVVRLAAEANERAGETVIPDDLAHPHALRHGYAMRYLAEGGTLGRLQQLLGHADVGTTARYVSAVDDANAMPPGDPWAKP